jgi:hypothetical protein
MKKLLLATVFALSAFGRAHAGDVTENEKTGCQLLGMAVELRFENLANWETQCPKLKKTASDGVICVITTIMMRNRMRGLGDMDAPPIEVRKTAVKGCLMLTHDISDDQAEILANKVIQK